MFEHFVLLGAIFAAGLLTATWLRHSQQRTRKAGRVSAEEARLDALPAAVWYTDPAGHCTYANAAWRDLTGSTVDETWRGLEWVQAFAASDGETIRQQWISAISREQFFEADWKLAAPSPAPKWLMTRASPQFCDDGALLGYRCVTIDVSRAKLRELELIEAAHSAEQSCADRAAKFADLSHEIRAPLNGVTDLAEMLAGAGSGSDRQTEIAMIAGAGRHMLQLIDDSLAITAGDPDTLGLAAEPVKIAQLLNQSIELFRPIARTKNVKVAVWIDDAIPELIEINRQPIRQVICHLIGNAIKFSNDGGVDVEARVESTSGGQMLLLSVIDCGTGIAPDQLQAILLPEKFEDRFPETTSTERKRGLAIVNQLAQSIGGTLVAHSKPDVGSNFTLRLPLCESSCAEDNDTTGERAARAAPELLEGARILLVEDDELTRHLMLALLGKLGLKVATAECSADALAAIRHAKANSAAFDAVLMDINLPGTDGLATTRQLRAEGTLARELPVIALTARTSPTDIAACAEAGMQAHITKPFTSVALARELARCLLVGRANTTESGDQGSRPLALKKRYFDRKGALLKSLRCSLDRDPDRTDWLALAGELNSLAGAASQFGEIQLGEASRRLQVRLNQSKEPQACHEHLRRAWSELQRAA